MNRKFMPQVGFYYSMRNPQLQVSTESRNSELIHAIMHSWI